MSNNYKFNEYQKKTKYLNLIHHELMYSIPFKDNSIPNIYSSHFFEHLFLKDCKNLLKECLRVLKPNGIIRIVVPSLDSEVLILLKQLKDEVSLKGLVSFIIILIYLKS